MQWGDGLAPHSGCGQRLSPEHDVKDSRDPRAPLLSVMIKKPRGEWAIGSLLFDAGIENVHGSKSGSFLFFPINGL
jgi:hypothetical protein